MRRVVKKLIPIASMLFASFANAAGPALSQDEAKLIGAWQEGLSARLADGGPAKLQMAKKAGLLGGVVEYKADRTFVMYPPCGPKRDSLRKAGFEHIGGKWELTEAGALLTTIDAFGQPMKLETKLTWKDDQLVLLNKNGSVANKSGRYPGTLPPAC